MHMPNMFTTDYQLPTTAHQRRVQVRELSFSGGPTGIFLGTNETTGEQIVGHLEWEDNKYQIGTVHVIFTDGIRQDYIVLGEKVFYDWP
ncbi:MAG: hypothetical protein GX142_05575 [Chloroflexi bacterium]|nr:hypothetical protein [Chloroflexota bacterium]